MYMFQKAVGEVFISASYFHLSTHNQYSRYFVFCFKSKIKGFIMFYVIKNRFTSQGGIYNV